MKRKCKSKKTDPYEFKSIHDDDETGGCGFRSLFDSLRSVKSPVKFPAKAAHKTAHRIGTDPNAEIPRRFGNG
jgi:hypothetical protein